MTHPKHIEVDETYSPENWHFERSYYAIRRNRFGYWATMYITHNPREDKSNWYPITINDKIAKSFPHLVKKVEASIARRSH